MSEENKEKCFKKPALIMATVALALSIISTVLSGFALYNSQGGAAQNKPVVISKQYDKGQNMEKALKKDKPVIVWFYTDWCGFCQRFAPTFGKITKNAKIKKNFAVAYVNADYPENAELMAEYEVQGFPTVFLYNPKTGEKQHVDNAKLFAPDAKKSLVEEFMAFKNAKKDEKPDTVEQ